MHPIKSLKTAQAVLELSSVLNDVTDIYDLPVVMEETISKYCHLDWVGIYHISSSAQNIQVTTNPHLPFNWNELYREIAPYDNFAKATFELSEGQVLVHRDTDDMTEENIYALNFAKRCTSTEHFMGLMGSKKENEIIEYGFYRSEAGHPFVQEDIQFFLALSPLIVNISKTLELYSRYGYKCAALECLLADEKVRPVVFDEQLRPLDVSAQTLQTLGELCGQKEMSRLPEQIVRWISGTIAPQARLIVNTGPFFLRLRFANGDLCCRAHILQTQQKKPILLIRFKLHETIEDFSILKKIGLTPREIMALEYLPLGYANKEIAMALGIKVVSVKKHLKNAAQKLCAANKTETLYQALIEKRILLSCGSDV